MARGMFKKHYPRTIVRTISLCGAGLFNRGLKACLFLFLSLYRGLGLFHLRRNTVVAPKEAT